MSEPNATIRAILEQFAGFNYGGRTKSFDQAEAAILAWVNEVIIGSDEPVNHVAGDALHSIIPDGRNKLRAAQRARAGMGGGDDVRASK